MRQDVLGDLVEGLEAGRAVVLLRLRQRDPLDVEAVRPLVGADVEADREGAAGLRGDELRQRPDTRLDHGAISGQAVADAGRVGVDHLHHPCGAVVRVVRAVIDAAIGRGAVRRGRGAGGDAPGRWGGVVDPAGELAARVAVTPDLNLLAGDGLGADVERAAGVAAPRPPARRGPQQAGQRRQIRAGGSCLQDRSLTCAALAPAGARTAGQRVAPRGSRVARLCRIATLTANVGGLEASGPE